MWEWIAEDAGRQLRAGVCGVMRKCQDGSGGGREIVGTEEEPAQTETRQLICFGSESPSGLAPLPTSANLVNILCFDSEGKAGQPLWLFSQVPPRPEGPA